MPATPLNVIAEIPPGIRCAAIKKLSGERCKNRPLEGSKWCRYHEPPHIVVQPTTGRYAQSLSNHPKLQALYQQYLTDPELTTIDAEIAVLRSALATWLEEMGEGIGLDSALDKHVMALAESISTLIERKQKIEFGERYTITVQALVAYAARIADIINVYVTNEATRAQIRAELERLLGSATYADQDAKLPALTVAALPEAAGLL